MMKAYPFLISLLTLTSNLFAQDISVLEREINPGAVVEELKLPPPETEGTYYIDEQWEKATIVLSSRIRLKNIPVRIDLQHNHVEIKTNQQIRVCQNTLIDTLYLENRQSLYTNCSNYQGKQCKDQLYEVLLSLESMHLLKKSFIITKRPTYVEAVDMGNRNKKLIIKEEFYLYQSNELKELNSSRKRNGAIFGELNEAVIDYSKKNKLKFNNSKDLRKIIAYYSSIKKG